MLVPTVGATHTPESLLRMLDFGRYELVDGQLVERVGSFSASQVSMHLLMFLGNYVHSAQIGHVLSSKLGLRIYPDQSKIRFADGTFCANLSLEPDTDYLESAPDLVLEVISPGEKASVVDMKVGEYLQAGVRLVWVVYPETRAVNVFRPNGNDSRISAGGALDGEDVLPGFSLPLSELFDL